MVENRARKLDLVFHALADSTRRELLETLSRKPTTVTELAKPHPMSLNAISKHLKILEKAGLIHRRRKGTRHYLVLNFEAAIPADRWIAIHKRRWSNQLASLNQFLKRMKEEKKG
jgi:DNA-binding transcriptional ArsR family regulator